MYIYTYLYIQAHTRIHKDDYGMNKWYERYSYSKYTCTYLAERIH